jgi:hypothetical protein
MWTRIRRPSPSMGVALVALFIALGGTGYAAVKINGKDIKNGTVTGKKLKNRTLGTAKLTTAARRSLRGQRGLPGPKGDPGPVDPSQFVPAAGVSTVVVGPQALTIDESGDLEFISKASNSLGVRSVTTTGTDFVSLHPQLPATLAGRPVRVRAVTLCVDADSPTADIDHVFISTFHGAPPATLVANFEDATNRDDNVCRRYELPATFVLAAEDYLTVAVRMSWTAVGGRLNFAGTTLEYERT